MLPAPVADRESVMEEEFMKRIAALLAIAVVIATTAGTAHAVGLYGIYWNPKDGDAGWGGGLKYESSLTPLVTLDGRISYITFPDDPGDLSIVPFEVTGCVKLGTLYGGIGVGYYTFGGDNHPDADIGWYLLAGISILPGPVSVFGEYKWQNLDPDGAGDVDSHVFHVGASFGR
jgi:hypothetical protein